MCVTDRLLVFNGHPGDGVGERECMCVTDRLLLFDAQPGGLGGVGWRRRERDRSRELENFIFQGL